MKKSLLLLASFAGLVACFGEKKPAEGQDGQTTTETCPAEAPAVVVEEKKAAEPATTEAHAESTETKAQ